MPEPQLDDGALPLEPAVMEALPELVKYANTVADTARRTSLRYFRADPELSIKADGSPVTVADRETQRERCRERSPQRLGDESFVAMMRAADSWEGDDLGRIRRMNRTLFRAVLPKRQVSSGSMVIVELR